MEVLFINILLYVYNNIKLIDNYLEQRKPEYFKVCNKIEHDDSRLLG